MACFVGIGGVAIWALPEDACPRWAALRGVEAALIDCPAYVGEHPVLELYNFSLGKHFVLLALFIGYFALLGRSRAAINLGYVYLATAMALDILPVVTWVGPLVQAPFPPIALAGLGFVFLAVIGIRANSRHSEWQVG